MIGKCNVLIIMYDEMVVKWMEDLVFKVEYDVIVDEFVLFDEMLVVCKEVGFIQVEVVEWMGIKVIVIIRMESNFVVGVSGLFFIMLKKFVQVIGKKFQICFV